MPFRPPVSTTLRAFTTDTLRHPLRPAGVRPHHPRRPRRRRLRPLVQRRPPQFVTAAGKDRGAVRGRRPASASTTPTATATARKSPRATSTWSSGTSSTTPPPAARKITETVKRGEASSPRSVAPPATSPTGPSKSQPHRRRLHATLHRRPPLLRPRRRLERPNRPPRRKTHPPHHHHRDRGRRPSPCMVPRRGAHTVRGLYSDFNTTTSAKPSTKLQFDGTVVRLWRTSPLWGVGTTAPYGHDGAASASTTSSAATAATPSNPASLHRPPRTRPDRPPRLPPMPRPLPDRPPPLRRRRRPHHL